jgi:uncharacterized protein YfaS (alpha-2-macroglobulin family)
MQYLQWICRILSASLAVIWLIFSPLYAQKPNKDMKTANDYYPQAWQRVDSLLGQGLPKSALDVVNEIYARAQQEDNSGQQVKALIHQMIYLQQVEEESLVKSINNLRLAAEKAKSPVKPLLHSMLAEVYWQYYNNHRWQFQNRSTTVNFTPEDINTWDIQKIVEACLKNHQLALQKPADLQAVKVEVFDEVIAKGSDKMRKFRPTLYDFIAHRAFEFLVGTEPDITQPAYQFTLNKLEFFGQAEDFLKLKITSPDTLSYKFHGLKVLQDLMKFHANDADPESFLSLDLQRLSLIYSNLSNPNKADLYLEVLGKMEQKYANQPVSALVSYEIAQTYADKGGKYNRQADDNKWHYKTAMEICQKTIQKFPGTDGAQNCKALISRILTKELRLVTDEISPANELAKTLIEYRNVKQLYWKVFKTTPEEIKRESERERKRDDYRDPREKLIDYFNKKTPVQQWNTKLIDDGDYQMHALEEKIPGLPFGDYIILAADNEQFSYQDNAVALGFTRVSNLAYFYRNNQIEGNSDFYVTHRNTGQPIAQVKATAWASEYNYNKGEYDKKRLGDYVTDKEGYFKMPYDQKQRNFYVEFNHNGDFLSSAGRENYYGNFYQYKYGNERVSSTKTFFFLDRAIYRPGQTIYFKGIVLESNGEKADVMPNFETMVYLYDVNQQKVQELSLKTNEFGAFSGQFQAPSSGLNGEMHLQNYDMRYVQKSSETVQKGEDLNRFARRFNVNVNQIKKWNNLQTEDLKEGQSLTVYVTDPYSGVLGTAYFSVEEYKRPKFEVKFEAVKGSYRLNEEITAKGNAKAYSGANIDGAQVKYRVVRQARFPYWWYWWRGYYPTSPEMEITNGVAKTNEKGEFDVKFKALPDPDVSKESSPTYTFVVYADVTDINGETRSGQTEISVAYQAIQISSNVPESINKSETKTEFEINSANLSGEFEPAKGTLTIHKLKTPAKAYRERKWANPDKFNYSQADWQKMFPNDLYKDENNAYLWEKESQVVRLEFDTEKSKKINLNDIKDWKSGKYVLEIESKDKYGEAVKDVRYLDVFNPNDKRLALPSIQVFNVLKSTAEPGQKVSLAVGSSEKIMALYEIEHQGKIIEKRWLNLDNEQKVLDISVKEEYRGNFGAHLIFIKNNRMYYQNTTFFIPRTNKQLDITFETYRNKLMPGEGEEWRLRLKGKNGEKVMAEMVATLYDASLDEFRVNNWGFDIYNSYYNRLNWGTYNCFDHTNFDLYSKDWNKYESEVNYSADYLNWYGMNFYGYYRSRKAMLKSIDRDGIDDSEEKKDIEMNLEIDVRREAPAQPLAEVVVSTSLGGKVDFTGGTPGLADKAEKRIKQEPKGGEDLSQVKARTNFSETAFFYPHLMTDSNGDVIVKFTIPEALTRWKMLGFAHTKDLKYGFVSNTLVTQKDLMVVPNAPRFFRETDKMSFASKITNISDKDLEGSAQLFLVDALTNKPIDNQLGNAVPQQTFIAKAGQSTVLTWNINIPIGQQAVTYKVVAKAGNFSDGEEMTLPVLTNRMLVTETMPLPIRSNQTKTFVMNKLVASANSKTLTNEKFTLEFTSNPAWYAVQALPYLMEFPHECAEQVFSRYYANALATHIANSHPKIKEVFESWKNITPEAFLSNLDKNPELKSVILEETPWLLNANNEQDRKRQVGVLFDLVRMSKELNSAMDKLMQKQVSSGAWTWFEGMPEDRYITQHIVTGIGHLEHLKVRYVRENEKSWTMTKNAVAYLDRQMHNDYEELKKLEKRGIIKMADQHIGYFQIQYLYARSFFKDLAIEKNHQEAFNYFKGQAQTYWLNFNRYSQGMMGLALHRFEDKNTPAKIIKSLKEKALYSEEMGMYWKDSYGFYWYQAPIETHAVMIELFDEVANDQKVIDDLKTWMIKQKQTQDWKTTKATAEACYALLLRGDNWLMSDKQVEITIGDQKVNAFDEASGLKVEAGTGYFKKAWNKTEIKPEMGKITVSKKDAGVAWGAVYWQYFENLDKITSAETPLKLKKQLFIEKDSDRGKVITPITEQTPLKVGDLVKVRIELRVDRAMEYVHMKDMRASGFEPTNVISSYKYQDGLGYYESTRDAATHFFISYLPKGTFVFEYPLRVTHEGDFSNGVTTIQCMYAPEFSSHSEGIRVQVQK